MRFCGCGSCCSAREPGASAAFGHEWLLIGGIATVIFGSVGVLPRRLSRVAGFYSVLVSSGTLLAVIAVGNAGRDGGRAVYLVISTLALAAFFLLIELVERGGIAGADVLAVTLEAFGDDDEKDDGAVGIAIPATMAILGIGFACCALLLAGLPRCRASSRSFSCSPRSFSYPISARTPRLGF